MLIKKATNPKKPGAHAENNSIAVGGVSAGGDISGNVHIENTNIYNADEVDYYIGDALPYQVVYPNLPIEPASTPMR